MNIANFDLAELQQLTVRERFHPATGELWFTDNGRDRMGDDPRYATATARRERHDELDGLPRSFAESLETDEETGKLKVTLDYPHILPFTENAKRRDLREELNRKFNTQAVAENRPLLEEAIQLRDEIANAFGLSSWAHHQLEEQMAKTPEANIIKLPNISASIPQLKAAIRELQLQPPRAQPNLLERFLAGDI